MDEFCQAQKLMPKGTNETERLLSFLSHFRNLVFCCFGDQITKILCNSLFTFFTEQSKTGKNGTHGNENLATYFWYFGSFDKKRTYENM